MVVFCTVINKLKKDWPSFKFVHSQSYNGMKGMKIKQVNISLYKGIAYTQL